MAFESFKPEVVARQLQTDRDRDCVFKKTCYKGEMIGDIVDIGSVLHIPGVGRPTVGTYDGTEISLEKMDSTAQQLYITESPYVNVGVDRITEKQAAGKVLETLVGQSKEALSRNLDEFLAGFYTQTGNTLIENSSAQAKDILELFAVAEQYLLEADVPFGAKKFIVISPAVYTKLILAKIVFQQPNEGIMGAGHVGQYLNMQVLVSNSIQKSTNVNHCMAYSDQAIALAEQIPADSIEYYKPEKLFARAFKCLHLFGGTVIRPKELVRLDITPAPEE